MDSKKERVHWEQRGRCVRTVNLQWCHISGCSCILIAISLAAAFWPPATFSPFLFVPRLPPCWSRIRPRRLTAGQGAGAERFSQICCDLSSAFWGLWWTLWNRLELEVLWACCSCSELRAQLGHLHCWAALGVFLTNETPVHQQTRNQSVTFVFGRGIWEVSLTATLGVKGSSKLQLTAPR